MIVDVHSHDFPQAIVARAMRAMCRKTEGVLWSAADGTLATKLDMMEHAGVAYAVSCPIATRPEQWEVILRGACAIREGALGARAQRHIVPFASVHPEDPHVLAHIDAIAAAGIKGVKFHPYYQDFSLASEAVVPMFRRIAAHGLIVQCHAGGDICWANERGKCGPEEIATLLHRCPDLTFVAAHLGGCFRYPAHATDCLLETNCYIDTSALALRWSFDEEVRVLRSWPTHRILFATDSPWVHYPEAIRWVRSVRVPEDWPALFGNNAARLLGLERQ